MRELVLVLLTTMLLVVVECKQKTYFTAGVLEHRVVLPSITDQPVSREEALKTISQNLHIYDQAATEAKSKNADIMVFPEYGLFGWDFDRETVVPFLEQVPDIKKNRWNPSVNPNAYPDSIIQHHLSFLAKNMSMYVVANLGSIYKCDEEAEFCPESGSFQYNTAVAFDKTGELIAVYHKQNLVKPQYDVPMESEMVTFTTEFGTFGLFMCEEIDFYDPAMRMIDELGIPNVACPTAWEDSLPNNVAIQVLSGFAKGYGINVVAANIHRPQSEMQGSGVFTPESAVQFYYDNRQNSRGMFGTGHVNVLRRRDNRHRVPQFERSMLTEISDVDTFMADVNGDKFLFAAMDEAQNSFKICKDEVCCDLEYSQHRRDGSNLYAFGIFSGHRADESNRYSFYQACLVMLCANNTKESCGQPSFMTSTRFSHLRINAFFKTKHVYPLYLVSYQGQPFLASSQWHYQDGVLWSSRANYPLVSAGFYGRIFSRDTSDSPDVRVSCLILVMCAVYNLFITL